MRAYHTFLYISIRLNMESRGHPAKVGREKIELISEDYVTNSKLLSACMALG